MKTVAAIPGCPPALLAVPYLVNDGFVSQSLRPVRYRFRAQCLELTGSTARDQENVSYIVGSFRNNCDRAYPQVTVSFKLERPSGPARNMPEAPKTSIFRFDSISGFWGERS